MIGNRPVGVFHIDQILFGLFCIVPMKSNNTPEKVDESQLTNQVESLYFEIDVERRFQIIPRVLPLLIP